MAIPGLDWPAGGFWAELFPEASHTDKRYIVPASLFCYSHATQLQIIERVAGVSGVNQNNRNEFRQ